MPVAIRFKWILLYTAYVTTAIIAYSLVDDFMGITVWRNVLASLLSGCVLLPFFKKLRLITVLIVTLFVQLVFPVLLGLIGLRLITVASWGEIVSVLPEIAFYGFCAWLSFALIFLVLKIQSNAKTEPRL